MSDPAIDLFRCSLPTDPASQAVFNSLRQHGLVCADHTFRRGGWEIAALLQSEIDLLNGAGVAVQVLNRLERPASGTPIPEDMVTGFVTDYLDAPGIHAAYTALQASFPSLSFYTDLPESTTGYDGAAPGLAGPSPVKLFRITTTPAVFSKPALLIVAGLHAREWAPPLAAVEFASQLLNNYDPTSMDPDVIAINQLVENLDILIVGADNPDGINFSRHDVALWRKNRRPNAGFPACPGVDLNRNFSIYWGQAGSSADPCDFQIYHGPSAFSEAEDRNIRYLVEQFPNILAAIDCHSFGEHFFRPQPGGGSFISAEPVNAADDAIYLALEASMNTAISAVTPGKTYNTGTTSNHAGTFDEFVFFGHRIFGFELEIGQDFQPPIADALLSVQEAAAVMRRLAAETINLAARFITPVATVQVVDKSSSMIGFGYVDATRANAARLADLMSLNDSTAIVSFSTTAAAELPLTVINSAGSYTTARAAANAISFGGSTSIGAGLQLGFSLLPPPGVPRSMVLLSDGFQNTAPMVDTVLASAPANVPVHTLALGMASDQALLQHIATVTGGTYHFSPDELGLFDIYNVTHSATADADMVLADTVALPAEAAQGPRARSFTRRVVIDCDADYAEVSVAMHEPHAQIETSIECLSVADVDLRRIERRSAPGYQVMRWKRPQPGVYELTVRVIASGAATCSVAAFIQSPLRLRLQPITDHIETGQSIDLPFAILEHGKPVARAAISAHSFAPATSVQLLARDWKKGMHLPENTGHDALPEAVARALAVRSHLRSRTGRDPFIYVRKELHLIHPKLARAPESHFAVRMPTVKGIDGTYNLRLVTRGRTAKGCPFVRILFRSVLVGK
ncbi:MAG TPA: M14 family zinc carboxypeptidase [Terriglobales bacterium]|nr:M14 family zinc carboxypeptidase [Terriglobales bacterium]